MILYVIYICSTWIAYDLGTLSISSHPWVSGPILSEVSQNAPCLPTSKNGCFGSSCEAWIWLKTHCKSRCYTSEEFSTLSGGTVLKYLGTANKISVGGVGSFDPVTLWTASMYSTQVVNHCSILQPKDLLAYGSKVNSEDIPLLFNPTKNGNETQALASIAKLMQST